MGRRIDDHSSWVGKGNADSPLPMGCKMKSMREGEGAGELDKYYDTEERIEEVQNMNERKMKSEKQKDGYRY